MEDNLSWGVVERWVGAPGHHPHGMVNRAMAKPVM
jgi:hypothetical protein